MKLGQLLKWTEITRVGNIVQDFSTVDVDGNEVSLSAYRHFWSAYGYGDQEISHVEKVYQKYHDKGFGVINVNVEGFKSEEVFRERISERNMSGLQIYDGPSSRSDGPLAQQFGIRDVPALVLIDTDGKVIEARTGKMYSPEAWTAKLEKLVATHLGLC